MVSEERRDFSAASAPAAPVGLFTSSALLTTQIQSSPDLPAQPSAPGCSWVPLTSVLDLILGPPSLSQSTS